MADSEADSVSYLNLTFTAEEWNVFVDNLLTGKSEPDVVPSTSSTAQEKPGAEAESSSTTNLMSAYLNLPHHLKSCLDYSYFVLNYSFGGPECRKDRLACLLLAEGLIKQDNSSTLKEDAASGVIDQLIALGMLEKDHHQSYEWVGVPSSYKKLRIGSADRKNLFAKATYSAIRLFIVEREIDNLYPNLCGLTITSLFDVRQWYNGYKPRAYMETICKLKSLVVLDLQGDIECLPDEIGDLVHLKYLRLRYLKYNDIPNSTGKRIEKEFEMMFCHMDELPAEVLDSQRLWHLMLNRKTFNSKVGVQKKIGLRLNLHTLTGISARGGIASELSKFTRLRRLGINCVRDEHASELCAAIKKMTYLLSLSIKAERGRFALFPELEAFSPLPRLEEVELWGQLVDVPSWLFSMENLSSVSLLFSYLHEDSIISLQFLPNLKHLRLVEASKAKQIGEEFCQAGGFPKLEALYIYSSFLVEWTEIANGAFPSLRSLSFSYCRYLMFLPNGLQNITTLDELYLYIHGDLERRLRGIENYKIKNIPKVLLMSDPFC